MYIGCFWCVFACLDNRWFYLKSVFVGPWEIHYIAGSSLAYVIYFHQLLKASNDTSISGNVPSRGRFLYQRPHDAVCFHVMASSLKLDLKQYFIVHICPWQYVLLQIHLRGYVFLKLRNDKLFASGCRRDYINTFKLSMAVPQWVVNMVIYWDLVLH